MAVPEITVRIAFSSDPLSASPTWTDVSAYVLDIPLIRRGRQHELGRVEAGEALIVLDNADRRFDPANTASPYYPNVLPMRKINIRATYAGTNYDLYTGFIYDWTPFLPGGLLAEVPARAVDAFKYFAGVRLTTSRSGPESSGNQIKGSGVPGGTAILEALNWPPAEQSVQAGQSTLQTLVMINENVLSRLQGIEASESGLLFINGAGKVIFQDRHWRLTNASSTVSNAIFGDDRTAGSTELPYEDARLTLDDSEIRNDIQVTRSGGATQTASDATSQTKYFARTYTRTITVTTDNETLDAANWLLNQYKEPGVRGRSLTTSGYMTDAIWPYVLGLELSDRITVRQRPPGGGAPIEIDAFIEAIEHRIFTDQQVWKTTWQLSPATAQIYWILDSSTLSVLDSTTIPAY